MTLRRRPIHAHTGESGFSLIELAIVLTILGIVISMSIEFVGPYMENQRRKETLAKLDTIEQALVLFAAQNRRLPCPANGAVPVDDANAGIEQRTAATGACTAQQTGVVPWRTLGLPTDTAIDGWSTMFLYRAADPSAVVAGTPPKPCHSAGSTAPTANDGLLLRDCDVMAATAITERLQNVGLPVGTTANPAAADQWFARPSDGSGAAYVLLSHGPNTLGGYNAGGTRLDTTGASALEQQNLNNVGLKNTETDVYVDTHDDILRFATIAQMAVRAKLQPR